MIEPAWAAALLLVGFVAGLWPSFRLLHSRNFCATCGDVAIKSVCARCEQKPRNGLFHDPACSADECAQSCAILNLTRPEQERKIKAWEERDNAMADGARLRLELSEAVTALHEIYDTVSNAPRGSAPVALKPKGLAIAIIEKFRKFGSLDAANELRRTVADLQHVHEVLHPVIHTGNLSREELVRGILAKISPSPEKSPRALYSLNFSYAGQRNLPDQKSGNVIARDLSFGGAFVDLSFAWLPQSPDTTLHMNVTIERNHRGEIVVTFIPKN